mgnify:CR=1 FL=1
MKALIYLKRTAANNLKKAVRKPTTLLALIFGAAYGIFLIVMLGTLAVTVRIDSVQGLVILVTVWTIYITVGNFMSYASRKGILFRPAHSQFVFPAPISPRFSSFTGTVSWFTNIFHMDRVGDRRLDGFSCGMVEDAFLLSDRMRRRVCGRTICYDHFIYE